MATNGAEAIHKEFTGLRVERASLRQGASSQAAQPDAVPVWSGMETDPAVRAVRDHDLVKVASADHSDAYDKCK